MKFTQHFRLPILAATLALPLGLTLLGGLSPASAAVGVCRSDPVFTFANGKTLTLNETITDSKSDVIGATYVLHIPVGWAVSKISYTGTVGSQQNLSWYADQPAGEGSASTTVLTKTAKVPVTANATLGSKKSSSVSGISNEALTNTMPGG